MRVLVKWAQAGNRAIARDGEVYHGPVDYGQGGGKGLATDNECNVMDKRLDFASFGIFGPEAAEFGEQTRMPGDMNIGR